MWWLLFLVQAQAQKVSNFDPCDPNICQQGGTCQADGCDRGLVLGGTYTSVGAGTCDGIVHLPEGAFPPLLTPGDDLYSADRVEECMFRCSDLCEDYTHFIVRDSDQRCACASSCSSQTAGDQSYAIDQPDLHTFNCTCPYYRHGSHCHITADYQEVPCDFNEYGYSGSTYTQQVISGNATYEACVESDFNNVWYTTRPPSECWDDTDCPAFWAHTPELRARFCFETCTNKHAFRSAQNPGHVGYNFGFTGDHGWYSVTGFKVDPLTGECFCYKDVPDNGVCSVGNYESGTDFVGYTVEHSCVCPYGMSGYACEQEVDVGQCDTNPCQNGGSCLPALGGYYTCNCTGTGYYSTDCAFDWNECSGNAGGTGNGPCFNDCECSETSDGVTPVVGDYYCNPYPELGREGKNCEIDINECDPNPCLNGATCAETNSVGTPVYGDYYCTCAPGYASVYPDKNCSTNQNYCNIVVNGSVPDCGVGYCVDGDVGYETSCVCPTGYSGDNCEITPCDTNVCQNGATCTDEVNMVCPSYSGIACGGTDFSVGTGNQTECTALCINFVESGQAAPHLESWNPYGCCRHDAGNCYWYPGVSYTTDTFDFTTQTPAGGETSNCVAQYTDEYDCVCSAGWEGTYCEISIDDCDPNQCQNGATCVDGHLSFTCVCAPGFSGTLCETNIDDCVNVTCQTGVCIDGVNSFTCDCADGYSGIFCEIACGKGEFESGQFMLPPPTILPPKNLCPVEVGIQCQPWVSGGCEGSPTALGTGTQAECELLCIAEGAGCCAHDGSECTWNAGMWIPGSGTSTNCMETAALPAGMYSMPEACTWSSGEYGSTFISSGSIDPSVLPPCEFPLHDEHMHCDALVSNYRCESTSTLVKSFTSSDAECQLLCQDTSSDHVELGQYHCEGSGWHPNGYYEIGPTQTLDECADKCGEALLNGELGVFDDAGLVTHYASWRHQTDLDCFCHLNEWSTYCSQAANQASNIWYEYMEIKTRAHLTGGNGCCSRDPSTGECRWSEDSVPYHDGGSLSASHCYDAKTVTGGDYVMKTSCRLDEITNISSVERCFPSWMPLNIAELQARVNDCRDTNCVADAFYPSFGRYNVSLLETLGPLFIGPTFNPDEVLDWDTSSVTDMTEVFAGGNAFNKDLYEWDTSQVTTMEGMFEGAWVFNKNLDFDTSSVQNFARMFHNAQSFNKDIAWDTSSALDMSDMFNGAAFNRYIAWDTSGVQSMARMFKDSAFDQDISGWDTSSVTDMSEMFRGSPFNYSLEDWDVSNVVNFTNMFPVGYNIFWCWEGVDLPNMNCPLPPAPAPAPTPAPTPVAPAPVPMLGPAPGANSQFPAPAPAPDAPAPAPEAPTPAPETPAPAPVPSDAPAPGPFAPAPAPVPAPSDAPAPTDRLRASWEGYSVLVYIGLVSIVALPVLGYLGYQRFSSFRARRYYTEVRQTP